MKKTYKKKTYRKLRMVFGDQLYAGHSWFSTVDQDVIYLIAELQEEATYVRHHVQKVCAFFAAMQGFAEALQKSGHDVLYLTLDDTADHISLPALLESLCREYAIQQLEYQWPDEYRLKQQLAAVEIDGVSTQGFDTEHFLLPWQEISDYLKPTAHNRMETFYRKMRRRYGLLMEGDEPVGGQWNYDGDNRNRLKAAELEVIPEPLMFSNSVETILKRLDRHQIPTFGTSQEHLLWPVSRSQSLELLDFFCEHCLPSFGRYQDAMTDQSPHRWSLYHSRLSFALNAKMLHPMQVIRAAVKAYEQSPDRITLPQIEGFVRQILGWREYVRAVYWVNMPEYLEQNQLQATHDLPEFFWSGKTDMNCMKQAIDQSLEYAYAHHIQRLMVTGNFCLLTGIHPDQVDAWYLGIYLDALEWVELPNTRGMSQFADGGWVATKPYAASGNYINKMSDYCKSCRYNVKQKTESNACPLNSLYWGFMQKHRERLEKNPRIGMVYRNWDKQSAEQRQATLDRSRWCMEHLDQL